MFAKTFLGLLSLVLLAVAGGALAERCTSHSIGEITYTRCADGTTQTERRIGDLTYSTGSDGHRAVSRQIGEITYIRGDKGHRATRRKIGELEYERGHDRDGNPYRCTLRQIGDRTYRSCD